MPQNPSSSSNVSSRFEAVLAEIIGKEEKGRSIDVERYCRSFPEFAEQLRAYFRNRSHFVQKARGLSPTPAGDTESPALPDLAPGSQFAGYEIVREMGRGGMGVVYLARQQKANRLVALKLIRKDRLVYLSQEQRRRWMSRFCDEAKNAARIDHDRVVTVYEVGSHGGNPFYAMRYIEGQSLAEKLESGPLPNRQAAVLMEQVARAVQAIHDGKVKHRDLKPHNILVDAQGRAYVTDFGLAKCADAEESLTQTGEMLGSPAYMSPEQAQDSSNVTEATDVYGLGATLYALLTGNPPFSGKTLAEILDQVKNREPLPPRRLNPAVDRDLNTITLRCLEKEPGRRLRSAGALADELQRYLEGRPILSRPIGPAGRLWRWCRRKPSLATISAAALLLMTLAGALSLAYWKAQNAVNDIGIVVGNDPLGQSGLPGPQPQPPSADELPGRVQGIINARNQADEGRRIAQEQKRALDYLKDMRQVSQLIGGGEHVNARELLNKWRESPYRAWEWHFAAAQLRDAGFDASGQRNPALAASQSRGFTFPGHRSAVLAVAFSSDGMRLASADSEGIVKIWDVTTPKELHKLRALGSVTALAWSPNGKYVAAACQGQGVAPLGGPPFPLPSQPANAPPPKAKRQFGSGKRSPAKQAGSPARGNRKIIIWDTDTGKTLETLNQVADFNPSTAIPVRANASQDEIAAHNSRFTLFNSWSASLLWCPNHRRLVLADGDGKIQIWDLNSHKPDPVCVLRAHDGGVHSAALNQSGNRLASVSGDGVIKIWDLAGIAEKPLLTLQIPPREKFNIDPTYSLVWTKEDKCINVVSRYGEIREVDVEAKKVGEARHLTLRDPNIAPAFGGVGNRGERFVWSPDAKSLASIQRGGELKIWDAATGKERSSMVAPGDKASLSMGMASRCAPAWDPSGLRLVMGGSNGAIQAWPVVLRRQAVRTPNIPGAVGWCADSRFLLAIHVYSSAEDEFLIEQRKMGEEALKIMREGIRRNPGGIFPPDPRLLELQKRGPQQRFAPLHKPRPSIQIHDSMSGELVRTFGNTADKSAATPSMLVASPDGKWVASLTPPGLIQIWPLTKGKEALPIPVETLIPPPAPEGGSRDQSTLLAWSPDSRLLAYTMCTDSDIQIWDVEPQKKLPPLKRLEKPFLRSLAWNPDGNRLAAASFSAAGEDGMVEIWDVKNTKVVYGFPYFVKYEPNVRKVKPIASSILSWCNDGKRLAVYQDNEEVKVWDVEADKEVITLQGDPFGGGVRNTRYAVAWSPDGKRLACANPNGTFMLYDTTRWQEVFTLRIPDKEPFRLRVDPPGSGGTLAWSPDSRQLAFFSAGGSVTIWDATPEDDKSGHKR